ncbi:MULTISPECIES: hypothetical protein [Silvimonas]|uniref:hypothetical protein n=1 Tax=Silvimonas TaxID=300264 RepID=UPI0024B3212A|nr:MULTISPECIES: hypothetical protein [Silvimonas]MDR3428903.1 hypothetical protein [Silvimonas sp.]
MLKRTLLALALAATAWAAHAADDAAASTVTVEAGAAADDAPDAPPAAAQLPPPSHPIFRGRVGEAPMQVAFSFLGDHASDEVGQIDYQKLSVNQIATSKDRQQVNVDVTMLGALESARAAQRFQLKMLYADKTWFITAARQDWKCHASGSGWTQRPCK